MRIWNRKEMAAPRAKPSVRKKAMTAPAVSASWASTFLGEKQASDLSSAMHSPCPHWSSTERWEEAPAEAEAVFCCCRMARNPTSLQEPASTSQTYKKRQNASDRQAVSSSNTKTTHSLTPMLKCCSPPRSQGWPWAATHG